MADLTNRPLIRCPDCGHEYPGLREPPPGATCEPQRTTCLGCGRDHWPMVWIADVVRAPTSPPCSERWPDDPEEERRHGPTVERRET